MRHKVADKSHCRYLSDSNCVRSFPNGVSPQPSACTLRFLDGELCLLHLLDAPIGNEFMIAPIKTLRVLNIRESVLLCFNVNRR